VASSQVFAGGRLRRDDFRHGVYSFERDQPKSAVELEGSDLAAVATFAADLQGVAPPIYRTSSVCARSITF
jgi:hypothetical protein